MGRSGLFHGELDRHPIPSFEEQIELGRKIRSWLDHPEGESKAPKAVQRKGRAALDRLVSGNLRLVLSMAAGYSNKAPRRIEEKDLVSVGVEGLIRAARKFDPERGYRFSTYATWWIRQAMQREARAGGLIRTPDNVGELAVKARAIAGRIQAETGEEPSLEQVASEIGGGVSAQKIKEVLWSWQLSTPTSLNARLSEADNIEMIESFGVEGEQWDLIESDEAVRRVRQAMALLDPESRDVLRAIYFEGRTLRCYAREADISGEGARQRLRKAKTHLKAKLQRLKYSPIP